jgi:transcriptional regulator with XRE-family HTH domain
LAESMGPTWRAVWLGETLRQKRRHKKYELKDVAEYLGIGASSVRRMETGEYPPKSDEMVLLLNLFGVTGSEREGLIACAEDVAERGFSESLASDRTFRDFIWAEGKAVAIHSFQLTFYSGLLQSPEYAEALIRLGPAGNHEARVLTALEARLARGRRLRKPGAPTARFILHESVLRQEVRGIGREIYKAQVKYLMEVAEYPNVHLRIAPWNWAQHNPQGVATGFTILELPDIWPTLVHVETPIGGIVAETPDIDSLTETYESFWNEVSDEERTLQYLDTILRELDK